MATSNANDSSVRVNRGRESKSYENQKSGEYHSKRNDMRNERYNKQDKSNSLDYKSFGRNKNTNFTNKNNYPTGNMKPKDLTRIDFKGGGYNKDKDYEGDPKYGKGSSYKEHRIGDSKGKSSPSKEREPQPDKFETIKRLEREKKAILKKSIDEEKKSDRSNKAMVKQRRSGNIDWTKSYNMGLFDDGEDYSHYM